MANTGSLRGTANELAERLSEVADINPSLAADIRRFLASREYGLVFEHNRPEAMRLLGKRVKKGDVVHVLPPRGQRETKANRVEWRVQSIDGDTVELLPIGRERRGRTAPLGDVVAVAAYSQPVYPGLREVGRVERKSDAPYHIVINGENFHVLESLLFSFAGKVDCIYIDPPYNSRANDWKFNNDYVDPADAYRHSKWLAFMERRLKLAKQLLKTNDSVLIATVDEKEYLRFGLLLEQIFTGSRIQMVSINNNPAAVARTNEFGRSDEYAFFVMNGTGPAKLELDSEWITAKGRTHTGKIRWDLLKRSGPGAQREDSPGCFYPFFIKDGKIVSVGDAIPLEADRHEVVVPEGLDAVWPIRNDGTEGRWQQSPEHIRELLEQGFVKLGKPKGSDTTVYFLKPGERAKIENGTYEILGYADDGSVMTSESVSENRYHSVPTTQWHISSHDSTQYGSRLLQKMLGGKRFTYPKSLYAVEDCPRFFVADKPDALIVDFFAGSGTTAQAVMRLNREDCGRRQSICVTNNEVSKAEANRMTRRGLRPGDQEWESVGICKYVTIPRITAAITGLTPQGLPIKGDYTFAEEFPMADGFDENAIFFDLTYQDPVMVDLDQAFAEIAPLLWISAGCEGPIIADRGDGTFKLAGTYGVLFDFAHVRDFVDAVRKNLSIGTAFVVTDDMGRYQEVCRLLKGLDVVQLYEDYLRTFEIAPEGI